MSIILAASGPSTAREVDFFAAGFLGMRDCTAETQRARRSEEGDGDAPLDY